MAVFELAGLANLQRLSLVRVQKLTDNAVFFLAEHAMGLERLHLSYCDRLSLFAVQHLLRKLVKLQHLTATGIPAFKRKGIKRFSEPPPDVSCYLVISSRQKVTYDVVAYTDV
jgi:F-box and leucine-rich repeat protein GRR1